MKDKWELASKESRERRVFQAEKAYARALEQEAVWHIKDPQIVTHVKCLSSKSKRDFSFYREPE